MGFFEEEGIETNVIDVSAEGGIRSLISGDADISLSSGIMGAYAAFRDGAPVRIVANEWSAGSDLVWYSKDDSGYETLEDCVDADIGFSQPSSSTHMVALGAISHGNLEDAEAVSVGGPPDANSALESDNIDLAWTVPPFFFGDIQSGPYQQVFTGDQIPPFDDMTLRIHTALNDWLANNGDLARSYFNAYQKGLDWAYNNKTEAAEIWGDVIDYDNTDILVQALEENYVKEGLQLDRVRNLDASNELAVEHDFIDSPLSEEERDELIDLSYV
jgi:NitT/TauT family transport system substrate-binding protein